VEGLTLVTGGTGTLGRRLVEQLLAQGGAVRVLSRNSKPESGGAAQWAVGDLATGAGLSEALAGVTVIVHCATSSRAKGQDVVATRHLVDAARKQSTPPRLIYVSIVGIDRIPMGYYRDKLAAEHVVESSGLQWTILRATQFHNLVVRIVAAMSLSPVVFVPSGLRMQPVEVEEVARRLIELVGDPARQGRVRDLGGPATHPFRDLVRTYLRAAGKRRLIVPVRLPGATMRGLRAGGNLAPDGDNGQQTFEEFLAREVSGGRAS
jgi:uncharacterized protein YbjT (DUF2867 family)